jgi:hypothetical protein
MWREKGQLRNIQTLRRTIRDHAQESDFSGVALEKAGGKIPKPSGGHYDHVGEMRQTIKDLRNCVRRLRNSLKAPEHPSDVRSLVDNQVQAVEKLIARMVEAVN